MANVQTASAPTAKEEQQASIPNIWRIQKYHVIESIKDEDGKAWVKIAWSDKLHLFFDVPEGFEVNQLIKQMKQVGSINLNKEGWYKRWPQREELIF